MKSSRLLKDVIQQHGSPIGELNKFTQLSNPEEEPQQHDISIGWQDEGAQLESAQERQVSPCQDEMPYAVLGGMLQLGSSQMSCDDAWRADESKACDLSPHQQITSEFDEARKLHQQRQTINEFDAADEPRNATAINAGTFNCCETHGAAPARAQCESYRTFYSRHVRRSPHRDTRDVSNWSILPAMHHGSNGTSNGCDTRGAVPARAQCESYRTSCSRHVHRSPHRETRDLNHRSPGASSAHRPRHQIEQASAQDLYRPRRSQQQGQLTTMMIRNIPAQLTMWQLLNEIDHQGFKGLYDYYYQPMDYQTRTQRDFAFVNFVSPNIAAIFRMLFDGKRLPPYEWEDEPITVLPAFEQGLEANTVRYFTRKAERHRKEMRSRPIFLEVEFSRVPEAEARARELVANSRMATPIMNWGPAPSVPSLQDAAWQHPVCDLPASSAQFPTYSHEQYTADRLYEQQYCSACGSVVHACFRFCPLCGERCQSRD